MSTESILKAQQLVRDIYEKDFDWSVGNIVRLTNLVENSRNAAGVPYKDLYLSAHARGNLLDTKLKQAIENKEQWYNRFRVVSNELNALHETELAKEECLECKQSYSPSLIESRVCIFCLCKKLKTQVNETAQLEYHIWCHERNKWWRTNSNGYTDDREDAGIYSASEARSIVSAANMDGRVNESLVPVFN